MRDVADAVWKGPILTLQTRKREAFAPVLPTRRSRGRLKSCLSPQCQRRERSLRKFPLKYRVFICRCALPLFSLGKLSREAWLLTSPTPLPMSPTGCARHPRFSSILPTTSSTPTPRQKSSSLYCRTTSNMQSRSAPTPRAFKASRSSIKPTENRSELLRAPRRRNLQAMISVRRITSKSKIGLSRRFARIPSTPARFVFWRKWLSIPRTTARLRLLCGVQRNALIRKASPSSG